MKPRNIQFVINQVKAALPPSKKLDNLRSELQKLKVDASYTAPELMHIRWKKFSMLMGDHLNWPPKFKYEERVAEIMKGC